MPIWPVIANRIQQEIKKAGPNKGQLVYENVRQEYLRAVHTLTGRNVIQYTSSFLHKRDEFGRATINPEDLHGFMTVVNGLDRSIGLDIILHSPGGMLESVASFVKYLRQCGFPNIHVYVPHLAMSAACLFCLSCDRLIMAKHSFLGPIDPQVKLGGIWMPMQAILKQFDDAKNECAADASLNAFWQPLLQQYLPGMVNVCRYMSAMSQQHAEQWLEAYMFRGDPDAAAKAKSITTFFLDNSSQMSHSRHIYRDDARAEGLVVDDLEDSQDLQDAVLSAHHAACITLKANEPLKIIENHLGVNYMAN